MNQMFIINQFKGSLIWLILYKPYADAKTNELMNQ